MSDSFAVPFADFERSNSVDELGGKLVVDAVLDKDPVRADAGEARISWLGERRREENAPGLPRETARVASIVSEMLRRRTGTTCRNLLRTAPATALSRSASSKMIRGAFPPSSIESFLSVDEDCCMRILPTRVLPVNETLCTCERDQQASEADLIREDLREGSRKALDRHLRRACR